MNKRFTAIALAVASIPLAVGTSVVAAGPAAAGSGPFCGAYPPGLAYGIRRSPGFVQVNRGSVISLTARVFRNGDNCSGRRVGFYQRGRGQTNFVLPERNKTTTIGGPGTTGLAIVRVPVSDDFRWFANYNVSAVEIGARSTPALVQIRR